MLKKKLEVEAEGARLWKEKVAACPESVTRRAQCAQTAEEVRALRQEVWRNRHNFPAAIRELERSLKSIPGEI